MKRNVQCLHRPIWINKCTLESSRLDPTACDVVQSQKAVGWTHQDTMLADVECSHPRAMHCSPNFQDTPAWSVDDQKLSHTRVIRAVPPAAFILSDLHPAYLCISVTCKETTQHKATAENKFCNHKTDYTRSETSYIQTDVLPFCTFSLLSAPHPPPRKSEIKSYNFT